MLIDDPARQAVAMHRQGVPVCEIADALRISETRVKQWLTGAAQEPRKYRIDKGGKQRACQMRAQGMTHRAIAERLGVTEKTVANWCREERGEHERKAIEELKAEGYPEEVIRAVFG